MFDCQFSAFLSGNLEFFGQSAGYRTRGSSIGMDAVTEGPRSNPAIVCYRQRAAAYLNSLTSTIPDSVPHQVAVQNRQTLLSSAESKQGLSIQVCFSISAYFIFHRQELRYATGIWIFLKVDSSTAKCKKKILKREVYFHMSKRELKCQFHFSSWPISKIVLGN